MKTSAKNILTVMTLGVMFASVLYSAPPASAQESQRSTTQASMRGIFQSLTAAYNYSLDPPAFEDPANHESVLNDSVGTLGGGLLRSGSEGPADAVS